MLNLQKNYLYQCSHRHLIEKCFDVRFFESEQIWEIRFYPDIVLLIGIGLGSIAGGHMLIVATQVITS